MPIVRPQPNQARLTDHLDRPVALRFLEEATGVRVTFNDRPSHTNAIAAEMVIIEEGKAVKLGRTLVFPEVLQQRIREARGDWLVGTIVKTQHQEFPDRIYYDVLDLPDDLYEGVLEAFAEAGVV